MPTLGTRSGSFLSCHRCGTMIYCYPSRLRRFCSRACRDATYVGSGNPKWRGGRSVDKSGYIYIFKPSHPFANKDGCVYEHRLVTEDRIGRFLTDKEEVHHINSIKSDNRPENLLLLSISEHRRIHTSGSIEVICKMCGNPFIVPRAQHVRSPRIFCGSSCNSKNASRALWRKRRMAQEEEVV